MCGYIHSGRVTVLTVGIIPFSLIMLTMCQVVQNQKIHSFFLEELMRKLVTSLLVNKVINCNVRSMKVLCLHIKTEVTCQSHRKYIAKYKSIVFRKEVRKRSVWCVTATLINVRDGPWGSSTCLIE